MSRSKLFLKIILSLIICIFSANTQASKVTKELSKTSLEETKSAEKNLKVSSKNTEKEPTESEKINTFFEQNYQNNLKNYPETLTYLGSKEHYDQLNDPSYEFYKKVSQKKTKASLKKLKDFDYKKLDNQTKLSYRLFKNSNLEQLDFKTFYFNSYFLNQMHSPHAGKPGFMINMHQIADEADAKAYIKRLWAFKTYFRKILENMNKQKKVTYPFFIFDKVISDSKNITKGYPFEKSKKDLSPLYKDFQNKISKLKLSSVKRKILNKNLENALLNSVGPAYEAIIQKMTNMKKKNPDRAYGVWAQKNGKKFYKKLLKHYTSTDFSAKEIHTLGLKEVSRIQKEMLVLGKTILSQNKSSKDKTLEGIDTDLQSLFTHIKENKTLFYPETKKGRQAYLKDTNKILTKIKPRLSDLFLTLPKAKLKVKAVEPYREKSSGIAFYQRPALNGSRPGIYYVNLYDMSAVPKFDMEALIYHEALPGHHMQLSLAQELTSTLPTFRRRGDYTSFIEGWGLYAEYIPKEMGLYEDPYSDFGRLAMELWRAARLVVDTGIHYKKWSYDKTITYLLENTPNSKSDVTKAVQRYFVNPGQATAYKIGQLAILKLREDLKSNKKVNFDIKRFHDAVLRNGSIPIFEMEREVKKEFGLL